MCQQCRLEGRRTLAFEVDHIKPKGEGGTDADENLQALCGPCHQEKTQAEAAKGKPPRLDA